MKPLGNQVYNESKIFKPFQIVTLCPCHESLVAQVVLNYSCSHTFGQVENTNRMTAILLFHKRPTERITK